MDFKLIINAIFGRILLIAGVGHGNLRSNQAKKNIVISLFIKGANMLTGFLMVPMVLNYIDKEQYGIWITLSSIIGWFGFFDVGMGHGLRNKFTEAVSKGDTMLARVYVSTTYAALTLLSVILCTAFVYINNFLDWNTILNITPTYLFTGQQLKIICLITFSTFCFSFVLRLITIVLTANQEPAKASYFDFFGSLINLIIVYVLTKTTEGSLTILALSLNLSSVFVLITSSFWFYFNSYKKYSPSFNFIDFSKVQDLLGLGSKFFIVQIAVLLLYQTNNFIIAQLYGPSEVTPYSLVYRYFNYILMLFSIVIAPFWSAFTDAWIKNEIDWVINVVRKLKQTFLFFVILGVMMLAFSVPFFKIWIGSDVLIPFELSVLVLVYMLINLWGSIFSAFMNGISRVGLQMYLGVGSAIINVPLAIYLGKTIGIEGIIIANIIVALPGTFIYPIYVKKLLLDKKRNTNSDLKYS